MIRCESCGDDVADAPVHLSTAQLGALSAECTHCGPGKVEVIDGVAVFAPSPPTLRSRKPNYGMDIL